MPSINIQGKSIYYHLTKEFQADLTTLLFVHGAGGTGKNWIYQLEGIEGYNLMALDLPGHGRSEGTATGSIIAYREFVWSFIQAFKLGPLVIVGHSMGGAIALELALAYPKALKGLIIVDSGARLRVNPLLLETLSRGKHPQGNVKFSYSFNVSSDILEKAAEEMKGVPTEVYLADFTACNEFNLMDRVRNILLPALIICGQEDQMTPVKYSKYLHNELAHSTIALISDAGHMAMLEQPDQVNRAINNFLIKTIDK